MINSEPLSEDTSPLDDLLWIIKIIIRGCDANEYLIKLIH